MDLRDTEWELDESDIASITSEDLYDNRPNRWTGPRSTWRTLTEEETLLWQSIQRLGNQNLSAHLYNAFSLKKRAKNPETAGDLTIQRDDGSESLWVPPKLWTAWPMSERHLPNEDLVHRPDDEDEEFTYRKQETKAPSTDLQEEITAAILRISKNRFARRMEKGAVRPTVEDSSSAAEGTQSSDEQGSNSSKAMSATTSSGSESDPLHTGDAQDEGESQSGISEQNYQSTPRRIRKPPRTYEPRVATDDDVSRALLAPTVRHIISRLDDTLRILHRTRVNGAGLYGSESSASETDSQASRSKSQHSKSKSRSRSRSRSQGATSPPLVKRPRGRPRKTFTGPEDFQSDAEPAIKTSRRGRPKKVHVPREGESHEEMMIRLAREGHRRLPLRPRNQDNDAAFEEWLRESSSGPSRPASDSENLDDNAGDHDVAADRNAVPAIQNTEEVTGGPSIRVEDLAAKNRRSLKKKVARWDLRDWSDVVGAAALAGFSEDVIARTAKRCADLFGQSMTIRQLHEMPASKGKGIQTVEYLPEPICLASSSDVITDDDDADDESEGSRIGRRSSSRHSAGSSARATPSTLQRRISYTLKTRSPSVSVPAPSASSRSRSPSAGLHSSYSHTQSRSHSKSQSRSRSASRSSVGPHTCPVLSCDRAVAGFTRRQNLRRHIQLIHGGSSVAAQQSPSIYDVDSDDEVVGAVHVDGFLKPIVHAQGWRGKDVMPRKRKRSWAGKPVEGPRQRRPVTSDSDQNGQSSS